MRKRTRKVISHSAPSKVKRPVLTLGVCFFILSLVFYFSEALGLKPYIEGIEFFHVSEVEVSAQWPLVQSDIKTWLPTLEGKSIFYIRPIELIELLKSHAWVGGVVIQKKYPSTLVIDVNAKIARAIWQDEGKLFYLDGSGNVIDQLRKTTARYFNLPMVSFATTQGGVRWKMEEIMKLLERLSSKMDPQLTISQVVADPYPFFRIFLVTPGVELIFSADNFENQIDRMTHLVLDAIGQGREIQRINLVFSKKAIVSPPLTN